MTIKLDMEKAYDRISLGFMQKMGGNDNTLFKNSFLFGDN